ncbi:hypothetical protein [Ammoniphilus sp. YIM 78166]|uniref:hypothetical protein n=1 Tax=Ammoniphilus sp. YIM 78166 TaxID=1644106 RepID=UPI00106F32F7|nr:hypothetical protein [Ammoniphilus sp. YIM 78166]
MVSTIAITLATGGVATWLALTWLYPRLLRFLWRREMYKPNFQGKPIPVGVGWLIPMSQFFIWPGTLTSPYLRMWMVQTLVVWGMAYAGWRDDRLGGLEAKGLRGHFLLWWKEGRISTGIVKVMAACVLGTGVSILYSSSALEFFLHLFQLLLLTNLVNLLDLRPGRAIKGFLLMFLLLLLLTGLQLPVALWLPTIVAALFLLRDDLRASSMLGDTGSNSLGLLLGCWIVFASPTVLKWSVLCLSAFIHLYAEKHSLSILIKNTPFLNWLDMWGRSHEKEPG